MGGESGNALEFALVDGVERSVAESNEAVCLGLGRHALGQHLGLDQVERILNRRKRVLLAHCGGGRVVCCVCGEDYP